MTGVACGPAWTAGCWLKAAMTVKEMAASETRVMARWRLSSLPSDANGVADKAARSVRIGLNRQTPWGLHTAFVGTRAASGTRRSIAHAYQRCQMTPARRLAPSVGWNVAPPNVFTRPRASSSVSALATDAGGWCVRSTNSLVRFGIG